MKKFTLKCLATLSACLLSVSAMAITVTVPTGTLTVPTVDNTTWKGDVETPYFTENGALIFHADELYQSQSHLDWYAKVGGGTTSKTWSATDIFKGNAAFGGANNGKCATTKAETDRLHFFRVTNCSGAKALVAVGSNHKRTMFLQAYEIIDGAVAEGATPVQEATMESSTFEVLSIEGLDASKEYVIAVWSNGTGTGGSSSGNSNFAEMAFLKAADDPADATLSALLVNGEELADFEAATETYTVELPFGTTEVPAVTYRTNTAAATAVVTDATALPGATTIVVTAGDGVSTKTYTINFTVAENASANADLSEIKVNGAALANFDADTLEYSLELPYATDITALNVEYTLADATATVAQVLPNALPGDVVITVTAQDGTTVKAYTIHLTRADAKLYSARFSNGFEGFIVDSTKTINVYYMDAQPTFVSGTSKETGVAVSADADGNILCGGNTYAVAYHAVAPLTVNTTADFKTMTEVPAYVATVYGVDASKGLKWAKAVEDDANPRISSGRDRVYFFFGPAQSVSFTWATERAIKVELNGVEVANADIANIALNADSNNMLAIISNQTKGDGGFATMDFVVTTDPEPTAVDNIAADTLDLNAPMYDVLGRRVNDSYKGIVIQNGHKYLLR